MMRSNISRLAVLGLAAISGQVFAAVDLSGQLRLDTVFHSNKPTDTADQMLLSRARLDIAGDISSDWVAGIRLEKTDDDANTIEVKRAYATWNAMENNTITLGRANHICANGGEDRYDGAITDHGALKGFDSDDLGMSLAGSMSGFGYKVGVVKTSITNPGNSLKWSFGARGHFTAMDTDNMAWALGAGFVHIKHENVALLAANYNRFDGWTVDLSGKFDKFALTAAYFERKDKSDNAGDGPDAKSTAYSAEASYLLMGDGYVLSGGMISGPKFQSSALELGLRVSRSTYNGAATSTGLYGLDGYHYNSPAAITENSKEVNTALSVFANYHVNQNAVIKVEWYQDKPKAGATPAAILDGDGVALERRRVTIRGEYNF